ncbi:unnamed protein product [Adineta ricciae]|uniref:Alpha/beta hydrolase fold-3 domain-containing protein n=2 Tax=Adineta ricciae TaxID=249248 RepID=A0A815YAI5_ADIRI|nr:unnamed protein product [Adineta ricciae]CAF1568177.1 unnamed protein product [Adineta ricciae]
MTTEDADIDHAYSPSRWSHRIKDPVEVIKMHTETLTKASHSARTHLPCLLNCSVDAETSLPDHCIDFYFPSNIKTDSLLNDTIAAKAIFVYIHGGYWQFFSRNESAFMAQTMSDAQIPTAVVGYPIAPYVEMNQIVQCVEQSLVKILRWAEKLSAKIYICGHSAGAHLASTLLLVNWKAKYNIDHQRFGGFFLISGIYDLVPLVRTDINQPLRMTSTSAKNLSPLFRPQEDYWSELKNVPILCVHGQYDSPSFHDQNRQYGAYLEQIGFTRVQTIQQDNFDHFDVIEQLGKQDQPLTSMVLSLMNTP